MMKDLKQRTKAFALHIIRLYSSLPKTPETQIIGQQILHSGTAIGVYYRQAHLSRSETEFVSNIEHGLQKLEETIYWLELLIEADLAHIGQLGDLLDEANNLVIIFTTYAKKIDQVKKRAESTL